jgi:hypothetical protein
MPHVPRSLIHVTRGRQTTIESDPIDGLTEAALQSVSLVFDGEPAIAATYDDSTGDLIVTAVITAAFSAAMPLGLVHWQLLPTSNTGILLDPLAEGMAFVTEPAEVGV